MLFVVASAAAVIAGAAKPVRAHTSARMNGLPRATADRPDDTGAPSVHVVYALPADAPDGNLDTNGEIDQMIFVANGLLDTLTGGSAFRIDTFQGNVDATFVRLNESTATATAMGAQSFFRALGSELARAGLNAPSKRYLVIVGGVQYPDIGGVGGQSAATGYAMAFLGNFLLPLADPNAPVSNPNAGFNQPSVGVLLDHELIHSLGFVPTCAPHNHGGHVSDDTHDLMYASGDIGNPTAPYTLDAAHDDYFKANIAGCPDFANSPYLTSALNAAYSYATLNVAVGGGPTSHAKVGYGTGTVDCFTEPATAILPDCQLIFRLGVHLTITAPQDLDYWKFNGWTGCSAAGPICSLTTSTDASITANYSWYGCLLPNLLGKTLAAATVKAHAENCTLRVVRQPTVQGWRRGRIVAQTPPGDGTSRGHGFSIAVAVGK